MKGNNYCIAHITIYNAKMEINSFRNTFRKEILQALRTPALPDGVDSNRPCPSVSPSVSPSVCPTVFKYLRDHSLYFSEILHEVRGQ